MTTFYLIRIRLGPVVRVSPNELSFASLESWKAIYGHRTAGDPTPIKSEFYEIYGAGFESLCIGSERDPHKHGKMRRMLSAAFSTKALLEQEDIITRSVDRFIDKLGQDHSQYKGLNMTKWYEMVTFDTVGEMAFGQSFHSVEAGKCKPSVEAMAKQGTDTGLLNPRKTSQLVRTHRQSSLFYHFGRQSPTSTLCSNIGQTVLPIHLGA